MIEDLLGQLRDPTNHARLQCAINAAGNAEEDLRLCDVSLAGCDLSGLSLVAIDMERVDFRGAVCCRVQFGHLIDCVLDGIDATHSHFPRLERCRFRGATLNEAFIGGRFSRCDFSGATLHFAQIGPVLENHRADYGDNSFDVADLHGIDAAAAYLAKTSLRKARLTAARLSRCNLSGCDLSDADLTRANLTRTRLTGAITTGAVFDECLMTSDQAEALRAASPEHTNRLKIVSHIAGPHTAALEQALETIPEYRFDWRFHANKTQQSQKIMIAAGRTSGGLHGYAFHADSRDFIRMYPMDEAPNVLPSILTSMAADYADWVVDRRTIQDQVNSRTNTGRITELLHKAIAELFVIA